ncbi:PTS system, mannitol-specific IIBC component [Williamsoniiplasma luminosum]|uniref:PTS system mannitol-specific EIICB component n=1 Tax=Williamsoniiplasma luminosum TaxID=214888 RepID=A0A2K8NXG6_9MOLU|nr:PTS mannitol transporter subunit IICB [Williamsoniiplasma luminosum]ATZ17333.1 PTS system, mannitol-specific IIBC component [Williamsoniiplasma luminosum]
MEEVIKEINSKNESNPTKLFLKNNFNKIIVMRRVQKFGGWLSAMIMPVIGVIIGWGLLSAFFIPDGWTPVKAISDHVTGNLMTYLIPILIGYQAGKLVHGNRGGTIAAFVVFGVIVGNQFNPGFAADSKPTPQFLGAMICGPIGAGVLKGFDKLIEGKIKEGFEMLVNNFSLAILGAAMCLGAFYGMPYVINGISHVLGIIVKAAINAKLIFLAALIIEPAKLLFLNNAINHGVLTPLGLDMARETGKSILFLLEANPGPGLGMLVATIIFDKKSRGQAAGASVIHFFGGIHEVYFPFALMRPALIISLLGGGLVGDAIFQSFGAGLIGPASPGSIIAVYAMTKSEALNYAGVSVGIIGAAAASLGIASLIFLINRKKYKKMGQEELQASGQKVVQLKGKESKYIKTDVKKANVEVVKLDSIPKTIIFACEAGMGSSAMGASILKKKFKEAGIPMKVLNYAVKELPTDAEYVITQEKLTELAKNKAPNAVHKSINNFLNKEFYDKIIDEIKLEMDKSNEEGKTK